MQGELGCEGKVVLGVLPKEIEGKLGGFSGNWLEYSPKERAVIVRHVQPVGCPALSGVPCELIAIIGMLPSELREKIPGGVLYLKNQAGPVARLAVIEGEVRFQWPHPDYSNVTPVPPEQAFAGVNAHEARINGWVRFRGGTKEVQAIQASLDRFEGLYPEGDILPKIGDNTVLVEFKDVNIGPKELLHLLKEVSKQPDSLEAELTVGSFLHDTAASDFRVLVRSGEVETVRPTLWR